jgi:hypothetical protein
MMAVPHRNPALGILRSATMTTQVKRVKVPVIARVVHYIEPETLLHRTALITEVVIENIVSLAVFNPTHISLPTAINFDETAATPDTWHWPEYVADIEIPIVPADVTENGE